MGHLGRCAAGGALDDALRALARIDSRKVQVELHFLWWTQCGRNCRSAQGICSHRDAQLGTARVWLSREMSGGSPNGSRTMETSR